MTIQVVNMKYTGQLIITDLANVWESEEAKNEGKPPRNNSTNIGKPPQYVDDIVLPEGFSKGDIPPPGMSFMGTDTPPIEKLIKGPFDDLIQFTAAQELGNLIDPELAAKAAKVLESSKEI